VRPRRSPVDADDPGYGPGLVLLVDPASFEDTAIDLGALASRQRSGLHYLRTTRRGTVVHLAASDPLPRDDWEA